MRYTAVLIALVAGLAFAGDSDAVMDSVRETIGTLSEILAGEYEALLEETPEAGGTVTLEFRIMPDGAIWDIAVEADSCLLPLVPLIDSLLREETVELSEPIQSPVPVTIPIELRPGD